MSGEFNGKAHQKTPQQSQQHMSQQDPDYSFLNGPTDFHFSRDHFNNSNLEHPTADFTAVPVDIQRILSTDDVLPQDPNTDASILQGGSNLTQTWHQEHQQSPQQQSVMGSPQVQQQNDNDTLVTVRPTPSPNSNISTPQHARVVHTPTPPSHPQTPQQQQQKRQQTPTSSSALLDSVTAQLPADKKEQFLHLFHSLQTNMISASDFLVQAKSLLGQQQYQQLQNFPNKSLSSTPANIRPAVAVTATSPMNIPFDEESRKRHAEHIRMEDAKRSSIGINTPSSKRVKVDHNNNNIPSQHLFTPQTPYTALQQKQTMSMLNAALQQQGNQVYNNQIPVFQQQQQQQQSLQPQPNTPHLPLSTPSPQRAMQTAQVSIQTPPISLPHSNNSTPTTSATAAATQPNIATPIIATPVIATPSLVTPPVATPSVVTTPAPATANVFKAPTLPATSGLQVPTKTIASSTSKAANAVVTQPVTGSSGGGNDRIDYDQITDVMAYANVDLKDEEQFIGDSGATGGSLPDGIDRSKMQDFMNTDMLRDKILKHAKCVNIKEIDSDFTSYIALAAQDRIRKITESMVLASKHRTRNPFKTPPPISEVTGHPLFKIQVNQNVRSQLQAIERVSRLTEQDIDPPSDDEMEKDRFSNKRKRDEMEKGWFSNKRNKVPLEELKGKTQERKVTVQDAIFVMERDAQGGRGCNQKALLRAYNEYLS